MKRTGIGFRALVATVGAALVVPVLIAQPAAAAVDPSAPVWYEVDVIGVTRTSNVVRYDQRIGTCGSGAFAMTCTVSASRSATRTIGTAFGISVAGVAATLGISSSSTVTIATTCSGTTRPPTYPYIGGYAEGTVLNYTVRQRTYNYGRLAQTKTSTQSAFNPTGIRCSLSSFNS